MKIKWLILLLFVILSVSLIFNSCSELGSSTQSNSSSSQDEIPFNMVESYAIPPKGMLDNWRTMDLKTIKAWEDNESKTYIFKAEKTPLVLNAGYKTTSQISTNFEVNVWQDSEEYSGMRIGSMTQITRTGINAVLIEEKGTYTIEVKASGCNWWVKIGVEK